MDPTWPDGTDWIEHLSSTEIAEVERAVKNLSPESCEIVSIRRENFSLPTLAPRLQRLLEVVFNVRGLVYSELSRWRLGRYASRQSLFFGIGAHMGSADSQNAKGHVSVM